MKLTGETRSTRGKACPSATLSTTNPTWAGLRGERPATNRLSHGKTQLNNIHNIRNIIARGISYLFVLCLWNWIAGRILPIDALKLGGWLMYHQV